VTLATAETSPWDGDVVVDMSEQSKKLRVGRIMIRPRKKESHHTAYVGSRHNCQGAYR